MGREPRRAAKHDALRQVFPFSLDAWRVIFLGALLYLSAGARADLGYGIYVFMCHDHSMAVLHPACHKALSVEAPTPDVQSLRS